METEKLDALMAALDEVTGMITKIREMASGGDAAEEQADLVDQATVDETEEAEDDSQLKPADDKEVRKSAMISMLKKSAI